jgi:hypothetical protein
MLLFCFAPVAAVAAPQHAVSAGARPGASLGRIPLAGMGEAGALAVWANSWFPLVMVAG